MIRFNNVVLKCNDNYNFTPEPFDSTDLFGSSNIIEKEEAKIKEKQNQENEKGDVNSEANNNNNIYMEGNDSDSNWVPTLADDSPDFVKFLKETYIGNEYDSPRRKQARYVIRNITGISIAIGIIFTIIWYTFPGKFISYHGDTNFQSRYQTDEILQNDFYRNSPDGFEDTLKSEIFPSSPRYSNEKL